VARRGGEGKAVVFGLPGDRFGYHAPLVFGMEAGRNAVLSTGYSVS